jgi:N-acetylneuraminic acid mutarotase
MRAARAGHTSTLLPDGRVLIAGGFDSSGTHQSAEVFDPTTNEFTSVASMGQSRRVHDAVSLEDGRVMVLGGYYGHFLCGVCIATSVEVFDPATGLWTGMDPMPAQRIFPAVVRLTGDRVLVMSGYNASGPYTNSVFMYQPGQSWREMAPLRVARERSTATAMSDDTVFVIGGDTVAFECCPEAHTEFYDPNALPAGITTEGPPLAWPRTLHTATALSNGDIFVAGGRGPMECPATAELFDAASRTWSQAGTLSVGRASPTATLLDTGQVLIVGGVNGGYPCGGATVLGTAEIWTR